MNCYIKVGADGVYYYSDSSLLTLHREDGPAVEYPDGTNKWYLNGVLHREGGPAVEFASGNKVWYRNGVHHREDGPAIEVGGGYRWYIDGTELTEAEFNARKLSLDATAESGEGCVHDASAIEKPRVRYHIEIVNGITCYFKDANFEVLHREDGPAIEYADGTKFWYHNGLLHREDGPAIDYPDGAKLWYKHGVRHREGGPASVFPNGDVFWWRNGEMHRDDGPAAECGAGRSNRWYIKGKELTSAEFNARKPPHTGQVVSIDGVEYELTPI